MPKQRLTTYECEQLPKWWKSLDKNRGDRAILRRTTAPEDALLTPAFANFRAVVGGNERWHDPKKLNDMAFVAAILARVTSMDGENFAKSLAMPKEGGSRSRLSELRFSQLQKSRSEEEFFTHMCRALNVIGKRVDILSLAEDILHWLQELRYGPARNPQDRLAIKWASDYYKYLKN